MDVRVDSNRIRSERENRGWSQDHLASVAGLSLRTIQRIEKTGSASFESVTALASVLSVEVAALRVNESEPSRPRAIRLSLELPVRLALAAVSGVLCALLFRWNLETMWLGLGWFYYGTGGVLFGIAVLCPYLVAGPRLVLRALALIGASTLSYFCAVTIALSAEDWFSVEPATSFLLASFIGVTIVLVAARILIPLRVTATFWFLGLVASLVGGGAIVAGFLLADTTLSTILSFCLWQMLACVAIYRGRQPDDAESGLFAGFFRTRGRFSVVPGWMKLTHSTLRKLSAARA